MAQNRREEKKLEKEKEKHTVDDLTSRLGNQQRLIEINETVLLIF